MTIPSSPRIVADVPVAVIGAGLSGLSCAQALLQAGHTVHVFDKSRGPSGRMSTRRAEDPAGPWQCDHGVSCFTASTPEFRAELARWQEAGVAARWDARLARLDGAAWTAPATPQACFVGTPRMTSPAGWLVEGLRQVGDRALAQWQTTVQRLERHRDGWALTSAEHGPHAVRYGTVLLAVPAPQAVPLLTAAAPVGASVAAGARMRGSWAVMVRCAAPVDLPCDGAFVHGGPLRWIARDSSKPGRTAPAGTETWLLHASSEWSEAHIEDEAGSVAATLLAAFHALGGPAPAHVQATAHRWRYADTAPALTIGHWWDADHRVGMCGDWLHGGQVEGAWLSGRSLARAVAG